MYPVPCPQGPDARLSPPSLQSAAPLSLEMAGPVWRHRWMMDLLSVSIQIFQSSPPWSFFLMLHCLLLIGSNDKYKGCSGQFRIYSFPLSYFPPPSEWEEVPGDTRGQQVTSGQCQPGTPGPAQDSECCHGCKTTDLGPNKTNKTIQQHVHVVNLLKWIKEKIVSLNWHIYTHCTLYIIVCTLEDSKSRAALMTPNPCVIIMLAEYFRSSLIPQPSNMMDVSILSEMRSPQPSHTWKLFIVFLI